MPTETRVCSPVGDNQASFIGTAGLVADARESVAGVNRDDLTPSGLARAILEGMVTERLDVGKLAGIADAKRIVAAGNAVRKNPLLPDISAGLSGLPCHVSDAPEEAALGAAVRATLGLDL